MAKKGKGTKSSKDQTYYSAQYHVTRKNKIKKIKQSNGDAFLDEWLKAHPLSSRTGYPN